jgi:hypothetical protein
MSTPFIHDYLQVGESADQSANPVTDPDVGISPEVLLIRFNTDTKTLVIWDPVDQVYLTVATTGGIVLEAENVIFDDTDFNLGADVQAAIEKVYTELLGIVSGEPGVAQNTFLVNGGQGVWISGFTFRVSAAAYYIDGVFYNSNEAEITLDAADGTFDRIDVLAVDTTGAVIKITGVATSEPSEPDIDPGSQLKLFFVLVPATATEPADIDNVDIYLENAGDPAEWDGTTSGSGFALNSAVSPRTGSVCILGTAVAAAAYAQFEKGSGTLDPSDYTHLILYIQSTATWANNRGLQISLRNNDVLLGSSPQIRRTGTYGFVSSNTGAYQQVAIPFEDFAVPPGTFFNQIRIADFGGAIGFRIDDITLQAGAGTSTPVTGITQAAADARYAPLGSAFAVIGSADATLPNERRLVAGTNIDLADTGAGGTLTISVTGLAAAYTDEEARDAAAAMIQNGTGITWSYDDALNTLTPTVTITQYTDELAQDAVGGMVAGGLLYSDAAPALSVIRVCGIEVIAPGEVITTGDGKRYIRMSSELNGYNLHAVEGCNIVTSSSGNPTIQIARIRAGTPTDMLSTKLTIDAGELDSKDATPAVVDAGNDDIETGDQLRFDVDVSGTDAEGYLVDLIFRKP